MDLATKKEFEKLHKTIEKGFSAVAEDMAGLRAELKSDIGRVQTQINSIEQQVRTLVHMEVRIADLEERVFGSVRK